jgi:hypothetical protein
MHDNTRKLQLALNWVREAALRRPRPRPDWMGNNGFEEIVNCAYEAAIRELPSVQFDQGADFVEQRIETAIAEATRPQPGDRRPRGHAIRRGIERNGRLVEVIDADRHNDDAEELRTEIEVGEDEFFAFLKSETNERYKQAFVALWLGASLQAIREQTKLNGSDLKRRYRSG